MFKTIAEIKRANKALGHHWFDADTMRFFGTRIESGVIKGRYFVTSEQPPHAKRAYAVRKAQENGDIDTVGAVCAHATLQDALDAIDRQQ